MSRSRSPAREARRSRSRSRSPGRGGGGSGGRQSGIACRWNERGFGFIKPNEGGDDLFCHVSCIEDGNMLREGDTVEYDCVFDDRKGKYRAEKVTGGRTEDRSGGGDRGGGYDDRRRDDRYDDRRRDDRDDRRDDRGRDDRRDDRDDRRRDDRDRY
eukprot:TRINITY_DN237_c0_g1_i8.p2 TRINITY_DN237_c0_g1~~TRINITY_DN237_c0_g1_i8.p2  ORF type:complete len:156 (+),score=22.74 TRINITY_DN237_c0_g1_i8:239-706(+)